MDEGTLEASILTYKQQLQQVETVLLSAGSEGQHELLQLKEDLEQVIQLTQESLLSLKKSKLLSLVDGVFEDTNDSTKSTGSPSRDASPPSVFPPSNDNSSSDKFDEEYAAFQAAIANENDSSEIQASSLEPSKLRQGEAGHESEAGQENGEAGLDEEGEGDNEDISGTKCSVYHTEEWGGRQRHNAVVLCVEPTVNLNEEACLRVLFCNPTTMSMKPCPYFLGGTCRFTVDDCRFSHGYVVKLSEIHSFQEPDFSLLKLEAPCLAKYIDGIWYPASIQHIDHDQHQVIVQYESYGTTTTLDVESILPSTQSSDTSPPLSSSSDNDNTDGDDNDDYNDTNLPSTSYSRGGTAADEDDFPLIAWTPSGGGVILGEWEAHTRGIGSKLMAKMGYEFGKGLGKSGEGRVEPVEAVVIPQGKSLDTCMELREMKKLGIVGKPKKKRSKGKGQGHSAGSSTSTGHSHKKKENVFDFINWKLGGKKTKLTELIEHNNIEGREFLVKNSSKDGTEENPSRKLNIQLVRTQEDIRSTERKLARLRESLQRNQRDKLTASQIEGKIEGTERLLGNLRSSEKKIQRQRNTRDQHRKLTVF